MGTKLGRESSRCPSVRASFCRHRATEGVSAAAKAEGMLHERGNDGIQGCGTYVEGFARSGSSGIVTDHAWITLDGEHAIDQTWPDADKCQYFGIPFSEKVLTKVMRRHGYYGLLDPVDYDLLELRAA
jgi:hypothetical protein